MLKEFRNYDVIVVKDNLSLLMSIAAKLAGKKLVYIDSLFRFPTKIYRKIAAKINLTLADATIVYSVRQLEEWKTRYGIRSQWLLHVPYTIDTHFYRIQAASDHRMAAEPYILSVGRDSGRDFHTLLQAARKRGIKVKLVTLPRMIPAEFVDDPLLEVHTNIPYADLFALYRDARSL